MINDSFDLMDVCLLSVAESGFAPLPFLLDKQAEINPVHPHLNSTTIPLDKNSLVEKIYELHKKKLLDISKMIYSEYSESSRFYPIEIRSREDIVGYYDNEFYHIIPTLKGGKLLSEYYNYQWDSYMGFRQYTIKETEQYKKVAFFITSKSLNKIKKYKMYKSHFKDATLHKELILHYWKPNDWTVITGDIYTLVYLIQLPLDAIDNRILHLYDNSFNHDFENVEQKEKLLQFVLKNYLD